MKLLFVADVSIEDDLSGAERVLLEQSTRFAARGHQVDILTRRLPNHLADHGQNGNVNEWRYDVDRRNGFTFLSSTVRNGRALFETLNGTHGYDCLNFQQPFSAFSVLRSPLSRNIRKVYTCFSLSSEEYVSRNASRPSLAGRIHHHIHRLAREWIEKRALSAADRIVVLSQYTVDKITHRHGIGPDRIAIIPGGIDLIRFQPADDKGLVREGLNLPRNKTILLTIRGLEPRMGIENLIRAMQDVVKAVPEAHLIIGGSGPLKEKLISMSRSLQLDHCVTFTGFIPESALPAYYQAADIFILPTAELEGFGLVTLEAMASGTPVLGTPVGGTLEILSRLDRKFLFQDTSPQAMSGLIITFCHRYRGQPDQWQSDSLRSRKFVGNHYSWNLNIDAMERVFVGRP